MKTSQRHRFGSIDDMAEEATQIVLEEVKGTGVITFGAENLPPIENRAAFRAEILDRFRQLQLSLTVRYKGEVLQKTTHTVESRWPATWWQMLKYEHAPAWFTKRWPVVWQADKHHVTFKRNAVYPMLPLTYKGLESRQVETFQVRTQRSPRMVSEDELA